MATTYSIPANLDKVGLYGIGTLGVQNSINVYLMNVTDPSYIAGYFDPELEFTANCTQVDLVMSAVNGAQPIRVSIDGGAANLVTFTGSTNVMTTINVATGLAAGNHHIRVWGLSNALRYGNIILTGGTEALTSLAKPQAYILPSTGLVNAPSSPSPITIWGTRKISAVSGGFSCVTVFGSSAYAGMVGEFAFTGTGVDMFCVPGPGTGGVLGVSIDGGPDVVVSPGDATVDNTHNWVACTPAVPAGAHTVRICFCGIRSNVYMFRVRNGTRLAAAAVATATTITVESIGVIAVGDWLTIGTLSLRELRQVTNVAGNVVTVAALTNNHAQYEPVDDTADPVGSISAYRQYPGRTRKVSFIGDSVTVGADGRSGPVAPGDPSPNTFVLYDPRNSYSYRAAQQLLIDLCNLGIQGQTAAQMAARSADFLTFGANSDVWVCFGGINDCNGGVTAATFTTSYTNLITACKAAAPGKPILCVKLFTPTTYLTGPNSAGLKVSDYNAIIQSCVLAAQSDGTDVRFIDLSVGMNLAIYASPAVPFGDLADALHPNASGQYTMATNLAAILRALWAGGARGTSGLRTPVLTAPVSSAPAARGLRQ